MKVKLRILKNSYESFPSLLSQNSQLISAKIRYNLSEDYEKITKALTYFEKRQGELVLEYKINKNTLIDSPEYRSCSLAIDDMLDIDIDLLIEPFITKDLLMDDRNTLSSKDMVLLKWLRVEDETDDKVDDKSEGKE